MSESESETGFPPRLEPRPYVRGDEAREELQYFTKLYPRLARLIDPNEYVEAYLSQSIVKPKRNEPYQYGKNLFLALADRAV